MLRPDRNARQRSPSSLGSNSQPAREKGNLLWPSASAELDFYIGRQFIK